MNLIESLVATASEYAALRRNLHAHPELCFQEFRTADLVADQLTRWGIPVHRGLGGTGVVGVVQGRSAGRAMALRADMDALPLQEQNDFAHASTHPGKMHACGHDGHTVMLLAAAQELAARRDFDGTVYLIFQPAEEGGGGARAMLQDGLLERFDVQAVFGMHNWPALPAGVFAASAGPVMASSNEFRIVLHGKGGHAAMPHTAVDPIPAACQLVLALQTIVSRCNKPLDPAVLSVTMLHAGEATNVIPDRCELRGTVRTFTLEVLDMIEQRMRAMAHGMAATMGVRCEFEFTRNYPPTINTAHESDLAREVMAQIVGSDCVHTQEPTMGAEDFSFLLQKRPGCYCFIGSAAAPADTQEDPCMLHNPRFDFNDQIIPLGATYWVRLVQAWFAQAQ